MNRRRYLQSLAGTGALAALAGCWDGPDGDGPRRTTDAPTRRPPETPPPPEDPDTEELADEYGTVVDMVADAGCDPDGDEPCDAAFRDAAAADTLLRFPAGTYRFERTNRLSGLTNLGVVGDGDVTFEAPAGHNDKWIVIDGGRDLLFRNVTVDASADNCAPTLQLGVEDGLDVRDVRVVGRGTRDGSAPEGEGGNVPVGNALLPIVRSPDGEGVVRRFVAQEGGRIGTYNHGDGRVGIYVGPSHAGTLRLVDCHVAEFPNNGVYASRTTGVVHVEGGTFRNNDISQVRLGSEGSVVEGTTVEVDIEDVGGPNAPADYLNPRGIRIESGRAGSNAGRSPGGVTVRDADVRMFAAPASPGIAVGTNGGDFTIESTRVRVDADGSTGILAKAPTGGQHYDPPPKPHSGTITDVRILGESATGHAVWVIGRGDTTFENLRVDQAGERRDGLYLSRSPNCTVSDCSLLTGRYPVLLQPTEEPTGDCLVRLDTTEFLGTTGDIEDLLRRLPVDLGGSRTLCVDPDYADMGGVTDPVIALTDIRGGDVLKEVISRRSLDS
ncbi:hypothetical protein [Halostella salina]|uniref:hypothetical protein n=1 Tax=Halostella salina TaxID=1547897 RepID=UPI000EF7BCEF|nr:hypothetical protein [Halostella salina]